MRLETLPLILGVLIGLVGFGLILDAWLEDDIVTSPERRKRKRRERHRFGEALVGLGVLAMAAAFMGRDAWRYSTIAVIAGAVLLLWGAKLNAAYLRGTFARSDRPSPPPSPTPRATPAVRPAAPASSSRPGPGMTPPPSAPTAPPTPPPSSPPTSPGVR